MSLVPLAAMYRNRQIEYKLQPLLVSPDTGSATSVSGCGGCTIHPLQNRVFAAIPHVFLCNRMTLTTYRKLFLVGKLGQDRLAEVTIIVGKD